MILLTDRSAKQRGLRSPFLILTFSGVCRESFPIGDISALQDWQLTEPSDSALCWHGKGDITHYEVGTKKFWTPKPARCQKRNSRKGIKNDILFYSNTSIRGQITKILIFRTVSSSTLCPNSLQNFSVQPRTTSHLKGCPWQYA